MTLPFQICKHFCKILNNLIFNQEKLKMCEFPLTGCLQKTLQFFSSKLMQSVSLIQKAKFYQNLTSESGSKQRFVRVNLLQISLWHGKTFIFEIGFYSIQL